ncbi:MAG: DUF1109 domain-containing protein, partial [Gallionella sp.]
MEKVDELISKLAQGATAVKPAPHPFLLCLEWLAAAALYLAVALLVSGIRPDLMLELHKPWYAAEIAALAGIMITSSLSAALLAYPDLHQMRRAAYAPLLMVILFVLVMIFAWQADNPPSPLPVHSFECTLSITLFSLLPAAWIFYVMRRYASTHTRWAGSIALLFAFSIGALWL